MQHSVTYSERQCKDFFEGKRWFLGGFLACILAGAAMSVQGVMNTRLGEHIGTLETNAFVQCTAAVLSLLVLLFWRTGSFAALSAAPKYCWFGGVLALAITVTVMLGMGRLGPTLAVAVILIAQLSAAAAIDAFGIMGTEKLAFGARAHDGRDAAVQNEVRRRDGPTRPTALGSRWKSCGSLQRTRRARTFASRAVFSSPHMSPEKMIGLSFAASAAKLYEVFDKLKRRRA